MLAAFATSSLFLVCYLVYHAQVGSVPFTRQGFVRPLYFTILITHVTLAATVVPLALVTLSRGLKARYPQHRRIARWTFPVWMYVSVTGVLVLRPPVSAHAGCLSESGNWIIGRIGVILYDYPIYQIRSDSFPIHNRHAE